MREHLMVDLIAGLHTNRGMPVRERSEGFPGGAGQDRPVGEPAEAAGGPGRPLPAGAPLGGHC